MSKEKSIVRGGADLERVYLYDLALKLKDGQKIRFKKNNFPGIDMADVNMRHIGRYGFALPFIRPGFKVLDFPCGSGLALEVFRAAAKLGSLKYEGWDFDAPTIIYAQKIYGKMFPWASFKQGSLTNFKLKPRALDTICCIEGIEHINHESQKKAILQFSRGLKNGGTLIISSPAAYKNRSGLNPKNPFHKWELSKNDFLKLLRLGFKAANIEFVTQKNILSTGQNAVVFYAICRK